MKSQYSLKNHVLDLWKILNISEKLYFAVINDDNFSIY